MRRINALFLALLTMAPIAPSQTIGMISLFPPQLKQYLELTDSQVSSIAAENTSLATFQSQKTQRQIQVQIELAQETAKAVVDPMALGLRHMELESIRRELQAEQEKTVARIHDLLTPAQKAKLESLRQAMSVQGVICEAQSVNLMPQLLPGRVVRDPFPGGGSAGRWFDTSAFVIPVSYPSCGSGGVVGGVLLPR